MNRIELLLCISIAIQLYTMLRPARVNINNVTTKDPNRWLNDMDEYMKRRR